MDCGTPFRLEEVISGGQTGVDRAALDVARKLGLRSGGWCPRGRKAEDGTIAACYPLKESASAKYEQRTKWNVRDSDGTLVLTRGVPTGGTALTIGIARRLGKPCLVLDLEQKPNVSQAWTWMEEHRIRMLNVAGPRESNAPGIHDEAKRFLQRVLG